MTTVGNPAHTPVPACARPSDARWDTSALGPQNSRGRRWTITAARYCPRCGAAYYGRSDKGFCSDNCGRGYRRGWRIGRRLAEDPLTYFWRHIAFSGGPCWLWTGPTTWNGYGRLRVAGVHVKAHRFSWEYHNGHIPDALRVLHRCDAPACVRPEHLFLGTQRDNIVDA